ncbi:hypothetical protein Hbl1158_14405 [Halobaculum sp. CBA1158]|nr:hypothetical protein [Halobaculum sp. CBA1158]UIO99697.1 hypothetical protein Hbl1158_14405 [Halobaculum sp. CBA1158]
MVADAVSRSRMLCRGRGCCVAVAVTTGESATDGGDRDSDRDGDAADGKE